MSPSMMMSRANLFAVPQLASRRNFLRGSAALTAGLSATILPSLAGAQAAAQTVSADLDVLGPKAGYSPMIGTLVSELTWMREANGVLRATEKLTQADLDYLFDKNANTIGALMLHLAATEVYYGMFTFDGMKWGSWSDEIKKKWDPAMDLGEAGRSTIKGHDRQYYVDILHEVREKTLAEFKKRDDAWLLTVGHDWGKDPSNKFAEWFHVCEHEAHHTGQIAFLRKRLPGAKPDAD
jgi:uncharacterized damage-inducible protein DinB